MIFYCMKVLIIKSEEGTKLCTFFFWVKDATIISKIVGNNILKRKKDAGRGLKRYQ